MRVLLVSERFWPHLGGVEIGSLQLLERLRDRGYEFEVVTSAEKGEPELDAFQGMAVHRLPVHAALAEGAPERIGANRARLRGIKRRFAPHVVHVNQVGLCAMLNHETAAAHPAPTLVTLRTLFTAEAFQPNTALRKIVASAAWVNSCAVAGLRPALAAVPDLVTRSSVIFNGLDWPTFEASRLPFDPPRLLCIGRLVAEKGFDLAIAALPTLLRRFPAVRLSIAGDGPARLMLERQVVELGLADRVEFLGWVSPPAVHALMDKASMVVIPSRSEVLPLVAIQAAQMARPLVGTAVGGLPELVAHGETGILVPANDSQALGDAIATLLDQPSLAERMGQASQTRARALFSLDGSVNAYDALYHRLVTPR